MTNLGKLNDRLRLICPLCQWIPPSAAVMEAVELHFQVEHDTRKVRLELIPVCTCGATMTFVNAAESAPGSGRFKDYHHCSSCGNTGFVVRTPKGV